MELCQCLRKWFRSGVWLAFLPLAGCGFVSNSSDTYPYSSAPSFQNGRDNVVSTVASVEQGRSLAEFYPETEYADVSGVPIKDRKMRIRLGLGRNDSKMLGCDLGTRFDNSAAFAYQLDDRQSRVSLHLSMDGPSFSNPGNLEFNSVMIRFTHKFQKPPKSRQDNCLFPSKVQGLLGSAYNELFIRNNYTILDELKDRGFSFK